MNGSSLIGLMEYLVPLGHIRSVLVLMNRYLGIHRRTPNLKMILSIQLLYVYIQSALMDIVSLVTSLLLSCVKFARSSDHHIVAFAHLHLVFDWFDRLEPK